MALPWLEEVSPHDGQALPSAECEEKNPLKEALGVQRVHVR